MTTEVIETDWYTFRELQIELARHRGKQVPDRTLQWWTQQLCISTRPDISSGKILVVSEASNATVPFLVSG
ncbi:MAG: hypothetical protein WCA35_19750 [Kovacikia sp.]